METAKRFYPATVHSVFSGDDLVVMVDLGAEDLYKRQRVRLRGVDTPTAINMGKDTEGGRIREQVHSALRGRDLVIEVINRGATSWIVEITYKDRDGETVNLNEYLVSLGYAYQRRGHHDNQ